jgi:phosphoribosylglycinamide formyltransferase-1
MNILRVAVLVSGRGSNLKAIVEAAKREDFPARIVLVISNVPGAGALAIAAEAGVATKVIDHTSFGPGRLGKSSFEAALSSALKDAGVDLVCLAGFMRLLSAAFVAEWRDRIINIHPSLLPAFKGLDVYAAMLKAGVKIAGCTVHFVSAEMDAGPIIGQAAVPVFTDDTSETLAARILEQEHRLYPECIRRIAAGEIALRDDGLVAIARNHGHRPLLNPEPGSGTSRA